MLNHFEGPFRIDHLRARNWADIPTSAGAYRWYFPLDYLEILGVAAYCDLDRLNLHLTGDEMVGLYFGIASNLSQRVKWHSAQPLKLSALSSGFLSTYRFSLLALTEVDYSTGGDQINQFMDKLQVSWVQTSSKDEAKRIEDAELASKYHYPINIQGNHKPEVTQFVQYLKRTRRNYKRRYLEERT